MRAIPNVDWFGGIRTGTDAFGRSGLGSVVKSVENNQVDKSEAIQIAHRICDEWLMDFTSFEPRLITEVIQLLQQLEEHPAIDGSIVRQEKSTASLLDVLRQHVYGPTPMRDALQRSLVAFRKYPTAKQRGLVLVSDGESTDGDPFLPAFELQQANVTVATVYLTDDESALCRRVYDRALQGWNNGQRTLFNMTSRVAGAAHPIPVLASMNWEVPSSGECALYATVCSAVVLEEFCSLLLSARFGSADTLLDVLGRVRLDEYIDEEYVRTCTNPSDQGQSSTCYAHATAAVLHMALTRIVGREGGCSSIRDIRKRILKKFPTKSGGWSTRDISDEAAAWYRPLRIRQVDEEGARQAVLRRRPVLTTFHLSDSGWHKFNQHFREAGTRRTALTYDHMTPHRSSTPDGGHAVVLIGCDPCTLTFLNSWGSQWGNNGSFSVEDHTVLEVDNAPEGARVCIYDVFWFEHDLTSAESQAYNEKVDEALNARAAQHPSIFELESRCPHCNVNAPIAKFTGSIHEAVCPHCHRSFKPELGYLVQALYARAGLDSVE